MSRNEQIVVGALVTCVLVVCCVFSVLIMNVFRGPTVQNQAALAATRAAKERSPIAPPATSTPTVAPTLEPTPTWVLGRPNPTATWVLQRPTSKPVVIAPPRTRVPGPIQDAWDKNVQVQTARYEMNMTLTGQIWKLPETSANKKDFVFLSFVGESKGKDEHFVMKGYIITLLTSNEKGLEITSLGDKIYLRGPISSLGAPEAKWYVDSKSAFLGTRPLSQPENWVAYGTRNPDWTGFKKSGTETLDEKRCDVYRADKQATYKWYTSVSPEDIPNKDDFQDLDNAEIKVWVCSDGYMHQFRMILETHSKYDPSLKGKMQQQMHFFDINGNISITAPASPVPFRLPQPAGGTQQTN